MLLHSHNLYIVCVDYNGSQDDTYLREVHWQICGVSRNGVDVGGIHGAVSMEVTETFVADEAVVDRVAAVLELRLGPGRVVGTGQELLLHDLLLPALQTNALRLRHGRAGHHLERAGADPARVQV